METVGRSKVGGPARLSTVAPLPRAGRGGSGGARFVQPVGARLLKGLVALPIPAVEGRRYRLRVWLKLDRLERRPKGQPPGLSAAVRFIDEKGEAVPYRGRPWLFGKPVRAAEWTERSLEFVVPRGAFAFEPAVLFTWYGEASVDDAEVVPAEPPDWEEVPGQGLDLHHLPGDGLDAKTREELTDTARRLSKRLGVPLPHPLHYYKYPDRKTLRYLLGVKGDVHIVLPDEVHSILPVDAFGIARLLADRGWAPDLKTPPLLSRGLAVALAGRWLGEPPEKLARRLAGQRRLPSIETMGLSSGTFYRVHPAAAYAVAGAFVGWLIDHFGIDRFKTLYTSFGTQEPGPLFAERVEAVYGVPLKALEVQWRASLAL
ncbi:MAG: hypothetical protein D6729_08080 [Deltaproteobacteria bacterium]|nr:MAG: hypothetical protein D6729_08080 [Deltaproteobacteria bacterium]